MSDTYPNIPTISYLQAKSCIQSCDILLVSGSNIIDKLIKVGTGSVWSHVGMLLQLNDATINRVMMMESLTEYGVRAVPLTNYITNYNGTGFPYNGRMMVARYNNFPPGRVVDAATKAIDLLGYPYSVDDIIKIAARIGLSDAINAHLSGDVADNKAYICSEYVAECYKAAGISVPYNKAGYIAPSDFIACADIVPLFFIGV